MQYENPLSLDDMFESLRMIHSQGKTNRGWLKLVLLKDRDVLLYPISGICGCVIYLQSKFTGSLTLKINEG